MIQSDAPGEKAVKKKKTKKSRKEEKENISVVSFVVVFCFICMIEGLCFKLTYVGFNLMFFFYFVLSGLKYVMQKNISLIMYNTVQFVIDWFKCSPNTIHMGFI